MRLVLYCEGIGVPNEIWTIFISQKPWVMYVQLLKRFVTLVTTKHSLHSFHDITNDFCPSKAYLIKLT